MPDMIMNIDTAVTVPTNILALMDDTDFKSREIGIVYNQAGMDLVWNFQTHEGVTTQTAVTPTTAGDYDWTHSGDAMYKIEVPASGGVSVNNDAVGFGWFSGICTGVLAWRSPVIEFVAPNYWHNRYLGSHGVGVFYDDSAANTNTVLGTDGTFDTPVSTPAAARTIADALGIQQYYLINNSTMTLAATHVDWEFIGVGEITSNVLSLGSQDVGRSYGRNVCIEGTQGGTARILLERCALADISGAPVTTLHAFAVDCGIVDDISFDTSADNVLVRPYSLVAGTSAPIVRATGASGTLVARGLMGGMDIRDLSASHNISIDGMGQVDFDVSCNVNATIALRGLFEITDGTAGMANLTKTAVYNDNEVATAIYDEPVSSHNVGGTFGQSFRQVKEGTISEESTVNDAGATATSFITALTEVTDNHYKDVSCVFIDGALVGQSRPVLSYNGTTKKITLDEALTDIPADGDGFILKTDHVHPVSDIADGILAATPTNTLVGMPTTLGEFMYFREQLAKNKLKYDKATDNMILYEDDGIAAKLTFAMTDDASEATRGAGS